MKPDNYDNYLKKKKESEEKSRKYGIIGLIFCFIFVVVVGYFYLTKEKIDSATGCVVKNGKLAPSGHMVFLLDLTDPLTQLQADSTYISLKNYVNSAPVGTLIELYHLQANPRSFSKPLISQCKRDDGSNSNEVTSTSSKLKKDFDKKFLNPLMKKVQESIDTKTASEQSPIIEALQSIGVTSFKKWNIEGPRSLVMYSDMLHHTPAFSHFKTRLDYDNFRKLNYAVQHKPDLPGVEVHLHYFLNHPNLQKQRNTLFWEALFSDSEASVQSVELVGY